MNLVFVRINIDVSRRQGNTKRVTLKVHRGKKFLTERNKVIRRSESNHSKYTLHVVEE